MARGLVAAFLRVRPALACAPPTDPATAGRGWPSPRTWEMTARLWAAADAAGAGGETRSALVRGCVGDGAGVEFLTWLAEMDLPDPEAVLADPASFALPERGDRAYAALAAVAAAVAADLTPERWAARLAGAGHRGHRRRRRGRGRGPGAGPAPARRRAAAPGDPGCSRPCCATPACCRHDRGPAARRPERRAGRGAAVGRGPVPVPGQRDLRHPGHAGPGFGRGDGGRAVAAAGRSGRGRRLVRGPVRQRARAPRVPPAARARGPGPGPGGAARRRPRVDPGRRRGDQRRPDPRGPGPARRPGAAAPPGRGPGRPGRAVLPPRLRARRQR